MKTLRLRHDLTMASSSVTSEWSIVSTPRSDTTMRRQPLPTNRSTTVVSLSWVPKNIAPSTYTTFVWLSSPLMDGASTSMLRSRWRTTNNTIEKTMPMTIAMVRSNTTVAAMVTQNCAMEVFIFLEKI